MLHAFASDEVMKHALASYAFEQFEAACYRALVTAAEQAGEREVASTCATILREEEEMAAWLWEHLPQLTEHICSALRAVRTPRGSCGRCKALGMRQRNRRKVDCGSNKDRRNKDFRTLFLDGLPDCWRRVCGAP
jgi:rubrerythrin